MLLKFSTLPTLPTLLNLSNFLLLLLFLFDLFALLSLSSLNSLNSLDFLFSHFTFALSSLLFALPPLSQKPQSGVVHHYSRLFYISAKKSISAQSS